MNISMYDKIISVEEQLRKIALDEPEYAELWSTWELNKKTLEPVLGAIIKDYPHYSFHDHTHSESILSNIERALGNDGIEKLSPTDLWMLLHVAYLHDFGMVIADYKIREFWSTSEFESFLKEQMDALEKLVRKQRIPQTIRNGAVHSYRYVIAGMLLNHPLCRALGASANND